MNRRMSAVAALALAGALAGGCTSLLGDFATGDGGAVTDGAPHDASKADGPRVDGGRADATVQDGMVDGRPGSDSVAPVSCGAPIACDGGCVAQQVGDAAGPYDLVIDLSIANGLVYWISQHSLLHWAPLDGGAQTPLLLAGLQPTSVAAVDGGAFVSGYDGSQQAKLVYVDSSGGVTSIASFPGVATSGHNMAVDGNYVYVATGTTGTTSGAPSGALTRVTRSSGMAAILPLHSGILYPVGVAVDAAHVYWADSHLGIVGSAAIDGSRDTVLASVIDAGGSGPSFLGALALDKGDLYWSQLASSVGVYRYATGDSGAAQPVLVSGVATAVSPAALAIAADDTGLYWGFNDPPGVVHIRPDHSVVSYEVRSAPTTIALSGCRAYWASTFFGGDDAGENGDILYYEPEN